jgi:hypothetical protein
MAKNKVKNNEVEEDVKEDGDIEKDMKTLGEVRDDLLLEYKKAIDIQTKINISHSIISVVKSREEAELFLLRVMGYFDNDGDKYCEGCPECDESMREGNDGDIN